MTSNRRPAGPSYGSSRWAASQASKSSRAQSRQWHDNGARQKRGDSSAWPSRQAFLCDMLGGHTALRVRDLFNVYCDESCHLENDGAPIMAQGAFWCPAVATQPLIDEIRKLKQLHNTNGELKWTKVSPSRLPFYIELIYLVRGFEGANFRALVVTDKGKLRHDAFNSGSHDTFYYKMYYLLLKNIVSKQSQYNIYLDIKDTRSRLKVQKLRDILCTSISDHSQEAVKKVQNIRSNESDLMQVADFLLGAVSYRNRGINSSETKNIICSLIEETFSIDLRRSTYPDAVKFNIFLFDPK